MKTVLLASALASGLLAGLPADASPKGNRGNGNGNGAWSDGEFCPPGLRHRDPPCVPPGQARRDREGDEDGRDDDDRDDGADHAGRIEEEIEGLVHRVDLSRDERQALAIIGGLMGLALYQQRARAAEAAVEEAPTVTRLAIPQAPPLRPAWIEALAPSYVGDAAALDASTSSATLVAPVGGAIGEVASRPRVVGPAPLAPGALVLPPPPLADDATDLIGGSVSDSGF